MSGNRTVSAENKLKAVHEYLSGKGSLEYIAKKYGVTYTPFRKWIAKYTGRSDGQRTASRGWCAPWERSCSRAGCRRYRRLRSW